MHSKAASGWRTVRWFAGMWAREPCRGTSCCHLQKRDGGRTCSYLLHLDKTKNSNKFNIAGVSCCIKVVQHTCSPVVAPAAASRARTVAMAVRRNMFSTENESNLTNSRRWTNVVGRTFLYYTMSRLTFAGWCNCPLRMRTDRVKKSIESWIQEVVSTQKRKNKNDRGLDNNTIKSISSMQLPLHNIVIIIIND